MAIDVTVTKLLTLADDAAQASAAPGLLASQQTVFVASRAHHGGMHLKC
jgi:hypothetical protein